MAIKRVDPRTVRPDLEPTQWIVLLDDNGGFIGGHVMEPGLAVILLKQGDRATLGRLADALCEEARRAGCHAIRVGIGEAGTKFWEDLGYTVEEELVEYTREPGSGGLSWVETANIRPFQEGDQEGYWEVVETSFPPNFQRTPDHARHLIANSSSSVWYIAEIGGKVVGTGFGVNKSGRTELHTLAVHADFRGLGIGRQLCCRIISWAEQLGMPCYLVTDVSNPVTHSLYPSVGFHRSGSFFLMRRELCQP